MSRRHIIALGSVLLCLVAVVGYAVWMGRVGGQELPFMTLDQGPYIPQPSSTTNAPEFLVLVDQNDADAFIAALNDNAPSTLLSALKQVDYQQFFLVFVTYGEALSGENITVQRVVLTSSRVVVQAKFVKHFGGGPTMITNPYHLIAVRKNRLHEANIHFKLTNGWFVVAETTHDVP